MAVWLSACTIPGVQLGTAPAPAPLAQTALDDKALKAVWQSFEVVIDSVTLMRRTGVIKVGSPTALRIADGLERGIKAIEAAEHAVAAGSTTSYLAALAEIRLAITDIRAAIRSN